MKSSHYRKILLIRFAGYFLIQAGLIVLVLILEPVFLEESKFRIGEILGKHHVLPDIVTSVESEPPAIQTLQSRSKDNNQSNNGPTGFGDFTFGGSDIIVPVSTEFGIVIEKINANARVIANVDPGNEKSYVEALSKGVAHAKGTAFPGQKGNIYLFSHSTDAPWNIVRYNAIFYLLGKLELGDRVVMFYQGRRFDYIVFDKTIAKSTDVEFLTKTYPDSVLTLQTCDPPGTLLNRLIVRAKLVNS